MGQTLADGRLVFDTASFLLNNAAIPENRRGRGQHVHYSSSQSGNSG